MMQRYRCTCSPPLPPIPLCVRLLMVPYLSIFKRRPEHTTRSTVELRRAVAGLGSSTDGDRSALAPHGGGGSRRAQSFHIPRPEVLWSSLLDLSFSAFPLLFAG